MNYLLIGVLGYVALQVAIGFAVSRRVRDEQDYIVAGRKLGYGLAMFSIFATWFGAETCIGSAGQTYESGLAGNAADPFGYTLCLVFMGLVFAAPLWRRKLTTLADLFRQRYGPAVERVAVLLMVPTSLLWAAAQILAFGHVLGAVSGWPLSATVAIAAGVVIVYTCAGGMMADAVTDVVQGAVLIAGLVTLALVALARGDFAELANVPPEHLALVPPGASAWDVLETWAVPVIGSVVAAELVARVIASKSAAVARRSTLMAAGLYLTVGAIPVLLGLLAIRLLPGLENSEHALVGLAGHYLPGVLYVIFAGALVSAILSTVDSALLVSGSLLAHNIALPLMRGTSERVRLLANRIAVAACGVTAYALALGPTSVTELVENASSFGSAGIFVILVFGLFGRGFGGSAAALCALLGGTGVFIAAGGVGLFERPPIATDHPFLLSLAAALSGYVLTALATTPFSQKHMTGDAT